MEAKVLLEKLITQKDLSYAETETFFSSVLEGKLDSVQIAAIITALRMKGETSEEILGFITAMRKHMIHVQIKNGIDVCGTGGDGKNTFNISTTVALVVAGVGVPVVKHGNKAVSSNCGSADVLEALGANIQLQSEQAEAVFNCVGLAFLFAPLYHPAMKQVAAIRKSLGIRTIFNILGPFTNPASVKRQIVGIPNKDMAEKLSKAVKNLNYEKLLIVSSDDGLDEVSIFNSTTIFEVKGKNVQKKRFNPKDYGIIYKNDENILGGNAQENARIIRAVLDGEKGAKRDIVLLNSAFSLYTAGKVVDIQEGINLAEKSIDSGAAARVLQNFIKETQKYAK